MSRNDINNRVEPVLGRRPATAQSDPPAIEAGNHKWLLASIACSTTGDIDGFIEESDDNVTFTEVTGSRVTMNAQTDSDHKFQTWAIDRHKRKRYVRANFSISSGGPATCVTYYKLNDLTDPDGGVYAAASSNNGVAGGVTALV